MIALYDLISASYWHTAACKARRSKITTIEAIGI